MTKAVRLLKNKMRIYFVLVSVRLKSNYYDIELMFLDKESVLCNLLRTIRSFESGERGMIAFEVGTEAARPKRRVEGRGPDPDFRYRSLPDPMRK